jgi:hypothetical protein
MRVPAAVIYVILGGLITLSWLNPYIAAALMAALAGATGIMMAIHGVHPWFGYFFVGSELIDPENTP